MSTQVRKIRVVTKKEDSAFLYHILESYEGLASYSTVDYRPHEPNRSVEIMVTLGQFDELMEVLEELKTIILEQTLL